jgi:hypothetical protein
MVLAMIGTALIGTANAAPAGNSGHPGAVVLTGPSPVTQKTSPPKLALTDAQRARIKQALNGENTEVDFALKKAKSAKNFEPAIGKKVPKGLKAHALPRPLIYKMPKLKHYSYLKFKHQVLIVNPMSHTIIDMFPEG